MTNNKHLPIFALILLLTTLLMGMNNAKAQDTTPPIVALTGPLGNTSSELTFTISALFTESTMGFTAEDVVVSTGSAEFNGPPTMSFEMERQSLTITHDGSAPEIVISIPAGSYTDLAGNLSVAQEIGLDTVTVTYTGELVVTVELTGAPSGNIGAGFEVTATFSESVTGFTADDIEITNATVTVAGSGATYTLTITPTGTHGEIEFGIIADATDGGNAASNRVSVNYDPQPFVTLSGAPSSATGLTPFEVTATFTEDVFTFVPQPFSTVPVNIATTPVTVTNGMGRVKSHSGRTFVLEITPAGTGDRIDIFLPQNAVVDSSFLGNARSNEVRVPYTPPDNTPPTATFSNFPANHDGTSPFTVTVILSETATDFGVGDVVISDNASGTFFGSGTGYRLTITPTDNNPITIDIAADSFTDAATNGNTAPETLTVAYAQSPATIPLTVVLTVDSTTITDRDFVVTMTTSKILAPFSTDDFLIPNGQVQALGERIDHPDGTAAYPLQIRALSPGIVEVTMMEGAFRPSDGIGPHSTASNTLVVTYAPVDTSPLTVTLSGPSTHRGNRFNTEVRFSEDVPGLTIGAEGYASFTITNATAVEFTRRSGSIYDLSIAPESGNTADISIIFNAGAATAGTKTNTVSNTLTVAHSTLAPVNLIGPDSLTHDGETVFTVEVDFSNDVGGFDTADDITISGGTTSAPVVVGGLGTFSRYALTITPDGTADITISLNSGVAETVPGNTPNAASRVLTVFYAGPADTTAPTVTFTDPPANHSNSEFMVTVTLSEPATDFVVGDIDFSANATGTLTGSGTVYTLTVTPTDTNSITIDIAAGSFTDAAGNMNTASETLTVTYAASADNTPPTVMLSAPDAVNGLAPFAVTATFSEPVTGFDATAITVTNGAVTSVTDLVSSSLAQRYTLTIVPDGMGDIAIEISAGAVMDAAGNGNTASTNAAGNTAPVSVTYDTTAPLVTLSGAPDTVNSLAPFAVTATFSEAVTLVPGAGIEVTNGAATLSGSGAVYTLTITPDGTGDLSITLPADVAVDAAGNGNEASDTVSVAHDATAPTVTLTGPDTLSNLAPFEVTATFSEDVTGLEVAEIVVTNGAVTTLSGSGANYVLTMTPTGNGDLSITIPQDVAVDAAANGNTASSTLAVVNTIVADTKAAITGFMLDRADKLARNQPGLTRFLQGTGCRGGLSANSTDVSGSVAGCMSSGHTWGEISNTWSSDSTYTLATVGVHGFMRDNLIIGGQVQFDSVDDDRRNITGRGWLVGPYFVHQLTDQNMSFEGRLLTGRTDNDISPLGSYEDSFDTERYLGQLRITGRYRYRTVTLMPLLDFTYTEDTQQAYTDTLGNLIDEQGVDLTQLTFGMDFSLPVAVQTGQLDLKGGLSGTYSEVNGGQSDVEGGRGRAELGLNYSRDNGTTLGAGVFYDGIGSDHESFGANLSFDMKF